MTPDKLELLRQTIRDTIGAEVDVFLDGSGARKTLVAYFSGYTKNQGPRFKLSGHGLKRHKVEVDFGAYARPCLEAMKRASAEQYQTARLLVDQVALGRKVEISGCEDPEYWMVGDGFRIEAFTRPEGSPYEDTAIVDTVMAVMVPLIAAMAELIGYEEPPDDIPETEGTVTEAIIHRRERSRRNKLLCLAIHGSSCAVCGQDPSARYGGGISIIEVHHVEPLHTLSQPRPYNPRTDLIPVCPNCHSAIHSRRPAYTPDELRAHLVQQAT